MSVDASAHIGYGAIISDGELQSLPEEFREQWDDYFICMDCYGMSSDYFVGVILETADSYCFISDNYYGVEVNIDGGFVDQLSEYLEYNVRESFGLMLLHRWWQLMKKIILYVCACIFALLSGFLAVIGAASIAATCATGEVFWAINGIVFVIDANLGAITAEEMEGLANAEN